MARRLAGHTDCLSHLPVDGGLGAVLVRRAMILFHGAVSLFISLARGFLLLLLRFPLFSNFLEL
jgi:hypothetical protein